MQGRRTAVTTGNRSRTANSVTVRLRAPLVLSVLLCAGCGGGGGSTGTPGTTLRATPGPPASGGAGLGIGPSKIAHVVFVVQENRSFDYIFGGVDSAGKPFPGADTVSNPNPGEPTPHDHLGNPVQMQAGMLADCYSPAHDHPNAVTDINGGQMNGFDEEVVNRDTCAPPGTPPPDYAYRYATESNVDPYWQIAERYVLADRMFEPWAAASFSGHLFSIAGQTDGTIDNPSMTPWGCDSPAGNLVPLVTPNGGEAGSVYPCFDMPTFASVLDARNVSWRYYAAPSPDYGYLWSTYDAIRKVRLGPEWTGNVISPPSQFLTDVQNGTLASMTWVTPTVLDSDHPVSASNLGPSWVATVVNAVGTSKFWNSTAVFVMWDDWGGWYDHYPPPTQAPAGLGIRVGLIVVSPYAKNGYVSHVQHTSGSVLRFAEEALNLPSLGQQDARSDDLSDAFNFSQAPTAFTPFNVPDQPAAVRAAAHARSLPGVPPDD
jgi:phospholipase C